MTLTQTHLTSGSTHHVYYTSQPYEHGHWYSHPHVLWENSSQYQRHSVAILPHLGSPTPLALVSKSPQLTCWPILILIQRPSTTEEQIRPENLTAHWVSHQMLGPCCLCPLVDPNAPDFVESAMYRATDGKFLGQFVATCAHNRCNYIGGSFQWLAPLHNSWNILH